MREISLIEELPGCPETLKHLQAGGTFRVAYNGRVIDDTVVFAASELQGMVAARGMPPMPGLRHPEVAYPTPMATPFEHGVARGWLWLGKVEIEVIPPPREAKVG